MKSVSGKNWEEININKRLVEKIKIEHNLSIIQAKILISRYFSETEIYSIKNEINLTNPFSIVAWSTLRLGLSKPFLTFPFVDILTAPFK